MRRAEVQAGGKGGRGKGREQSYRGRAQGQRRTAPSLSLIMMTVIQACNTPSSPTAPRPTESSAWRNAPHVHACASRP